MSNEVKTKVCSKCGRELPLNYEYFEVRKKGSKDGFRGTCRQCQGKVLKTNRGKVKLLEKVPELEMFLVNKNDGYELSYSSNKHIDVKCPLCGYQKKMIVGDLYRQGFGCMVCSDGVSIGEKSISVILNQLNTKYVREKSFSWSLNKRYDFYIPEIEGILEVHGMQHYKETSIGRGNGRTFEEELKNDAFKKELALNNGIKHYIVIDCRYSKLKYIKSSVISNYDFSSIFNINDIVWEDLTSKIFIEPFLVKRKTNKNVVKNDVKQKTVKERKPIEITSAEYFEKTIELYKDNKTITEISNILDIGRDTVRVYLTRADFLDIINYNPLDNANFKYNNDGKIVPKYDREEIVSMYTNGTTIKDISKVLTCDVDTVRRVIKEASKKGLCEYDGAYNSSRSKSKRVWNDITKTEYETLTEASEKSGIPLTTLRRYCKDDKNKEWYIKLESVV